MIIAAHFLCLSFITHRRRWVNPRLDREDSPELLGLLNLLYDVLEEHGMQLDFPFPMRKPG